MKKRFGDRKDGKLLRDLDSLHIITPMLYPNRCDNEAFVSERIDITNLLDFISKKNEADAKYRYTVFHVIVASALKTIILRPKMNRFIQNKNTYERNDFSASFVVKKEFNDNGGEALAFIHAEPSDTFESIHNKIYERILSCRSKEIDGSTKSMDIVGKLPRFLTKAVVLFCRMLDKHGLVPSSMISSDPYYSSVVLTNLGSIKLHSGYHHLTNWGTNSVFVIVGEVKKRPFFNDDGTFTMRDSIDIGLTIDERIADGYYYSQTVKLLKKLIENPELLEKPFNEEVEI